MCVKVRGFTRRAAIVGVLAALPVVALAQLGLDEPPRVVMLNLAANQEAGKTAVIEFRAALQSDDGVRNISPGPLANALALPIELDADAALRQTLGRVDELLTGALKDRGDFKFDDAIAKLEQAERALMPLEPGANVMTRLADVNFQLGLVYMSQTDPAAAADVFRVTHRLSPGRTLDPARTFPEVIKAFQAAGAPQAKTARVIVNAPFDGAAVYIDGVKRGVTPLDIKVEPGLHYFWGTLPDKKPAGAKDDASRRVTREVRLDIQRIPDEDLAREIRRDLLTRTVPASDEVYATAAQKVAVLTGEQIVVILVERGQDQLWVASYDRAQRRLSEWTRFESGQAASIIKALPGRLDLDPKNVTDPTPDAGIRIPIPPKPTPWYKQPAAWGAVGGAAVIVTVSVFILTRQSEPPPERPDFACCGGFE